MLWLLQCLDGESSSGESSVPQIRSIGQGKGIWDEFNDYKVLKNYFADRGT
jgi:hypothetical protein